jgi:hypothetical protein
MKGDLATGTISTEEEGAVAITLYRITDVKNKLIIMIQGKEQSKDAIDEDLKKIARNGSFYM